MKKILLSFCSLADKWLPSLDVVNGHYSLGLGLLAAVMEQSGHACRVLFMPGMSRHECLDLLLRTIADERPDVIGFGIMSDNRVASYRAIEMVSAHHPEIPVVIGGVHTTVMYKQLLGKYPHVIAVLGEGEHTLPELVDALASGRNLAEVAGIAFVRDGVVVTSPSRPLIENLDELPVAKHELFFAPGRTQAQIITSRGCPFRCSFCVLDVMSQRRVRRRSIGSIVDEIEGILARFPRVTAFHILDDQFFLLKRHVIEFCDEIVRRGIHKRVVFLCQGRMKPMDREMVLAMEGAGFVHVYLGLESGSRQILKRCHKGTTPEDALRALEAFAGSTINVQVFLVIGLPGENRETILETVELCRELQKRHYHYYSNKVQTAFVYPGAELYDIAKQASMVDDDFWLTDQDVPEFTVEHNRQEMLGYRALLLNRLCATRIFTPKGFASQKEMIHYIVRWAFVSPSSENSDFRYLALHLAKKMWADGTLHVDVEKQLLADTTSGCGLTRIVRSKGTDRKFLICISRPPQGVSFFESLISYAYTQEGGTLTRLIDKEIEKFLGEVMNMSDPFSVLRTIPGFSKFLDEQRALFDVYAAEA